MAEEGKKYAYRSLLRDANGYMRVVLIDEATGQPVPDDQWGVYTIRGIEGSGDDIKTADEETTDTNDDGVTDPGEGIKSGDFNISGGDTSDRGGPEGLEGIDDNGDGIMDAFADPLTGERVIDNVPVGPDFMYDVQERLGQYVGKPVVGLMDRNKVVRGFRDTVVPTVNEFLIDENARNQARNMEEATQGVQTQAVGRTGFDSQLGMEGLNPESRPGVDQGQMDFGSTRNTTAEQFGFRSPEQVATGLQGLQTPEALDRALYGNELDPLSNIESRVGLDARESRVDPDARSVDTETYSMGPDGSYTSARDSREQQGFDKSLGTGQVENVATEVNNIDRDGFMETVSLAEGTHQSNDRVNDPYDVTVDYNEHVGPVDLSNMSLAEALAVGETLIDATKDRYGDSRGKRGSSAKGIAQITNENMRGQMATRGFSPDAKFNEPMQEQMAQGIVQGLTGNVWGAGVTPSMMGSTWAGLNTPAEQRAAVEAWNNDYGLKSVSNKGIAPSSKPGRGFNAMGPESINEAQGFSFGGVGPSYGLDSYTTAEAVDKTSTANNKGFGFSSNPGAGGKSVSTESITGDGRTGFGSFGDSFGPDAGGFSNLGSNSNDENDSAGYGNQGGGYGSWGGGDVDSDQSSGGDGSGWGGGGEGVSSSESAESAGYGSGSGGEFGGAGGGFGGGGAGSGGGMSGAESAAEGGWGGDAGGEFGGWGGGGNTGSEASETAGGGSGGGGGGYW
jgi:hypothetical protein